MEQFLEGNGKVVIENASEQIFVCPIEVFMILELDYVPLASPYIYRNWTPPRQFKSTGSSQVGDDFYTLERFADYISKIAAYQIAYTQNYLCLTSDVIVEICSYESGWLSADQHLKVSSGDLALIDPVIHPSGVPRWVTEVPSPEIVIDGVGLRVRTTGELETFQEYLDWEAEQAAQYAQAQAQADFISNAPTVLKTMTVSEAQAWIETNVTDLASAKTTLKHFALAIILMRDFMRITR
jgi:hypothetical protein